MLLYRVIMWGSASLVIAAGLLYGLAVGMAAADGPTGIEVSERVGVTAFTVMIIGAINFTAMWAIRCNSRETARLVAQAILDERPQLIADITAAVVTGDEMQVMLDSALARARTYGMTHQARLAAGASNAGPVAHSNVKQLRQEV